MEDKLQLITQKIKNIPTIPVIAVKVMEMISDENTTPVQLNKLISQDQGMSSSILKLSNSSYFRPRKPAKTLTQAIMLLGYRNLQKLLLAASLRNLYPSFGEHEQLLWDHSMGVANGSAELAKRLGFKWADEVYLGGLFHDMGKVVMLGEIPEYRGVLDRVDLEKEDIIDAEAEAFGFTHVEVGTMVLGRWNMEEELLKMVLAHHEFILAGEDVKERVAVISLVNVLCRKLGIGFRNPDPEIDLFMFEPMELFNMSEKDLEDISVYITQSYEEAKKLFAA